jgi:hypothetical protein
LDVELAGDLIRDWIGDKCLSIFEATRTKRGRQLKYPHSSEWIVRRIDCNRNAVCHFPNLIPGCCPRVAESFFQQSLFCFGPQSALSRRSSMVVSPESVRVLHPKSIVTGSISLCPTIGRPPLSVNFSRCLTSSRSISIPATAIPRAT